MNYTLRAEVEYEGREDLVNYVTQQVSQMLMAGVKAGMDPFGMLAKEPSEVWCYDWKKIIEESGSAMGVRSIVDQYSTEKLEEIAALGIAIAANGTLSMPRSPEVKTDFAIATMSAVTRTITGIDPSDDDDEDGVSDVHRALAAYMNEVAKGCDGFTGEDFELVSPRASGRPPIILSAKVDVTELDGWTNFLEGVFDGSDTWSELGSDGVGVYGGIEPSRLINIGFVLFAVDNPNAPVGVADTIEHAQVVHDWFANKDVETVAIGIEQIG